MNIELLATASHLWYAEISSLYALVQQGTTHTFDTAPITGLHFLHGDVLARRYQQEWVAGKKYPLLHFPTGMTREIFQDSSPIDSVNIFGAFHLPHRATRDEAFAAVVPLATEQGFNILKLDETVLTLLSPNLDRGYHVQYDNSRRELVNIMRFPEYAMDLLDGESRAILPALYSNEQKGLDAVASVKFFTPDANWSWYCSEYDGEAIFFGLVSGFDVELGTFSLAELESVRGALGLPIERDLYFQPTTLVFHHTDN